MNQVKNLTLKVTNGADQSDPLGEGDALHLRVELVDGKNYGLVSKRYNKGEMPLEDAAQFLEEASRNLYRHINHGQFTATPLPQEMAATP